MNKKYIIFFLLSFFSVEPVFGAFSNYNSILVGDEAAGMGGAGTALLGDVSSAGFYNPALLAFFEGTSFSASASIYKKFDTIYGDKEDFTKAALRVNLGFFRSIPASTGSVITWRDYKLGLSIVVPDYNYYKGDVSTLDTSTTTLSYLDESLWVGGAISKKIDEVSSAGLTLYYTARNYTNSVNDSTYPTPATAIFFNSERTITANSIIPVLGYFRKLDTHWAGGLSLRLPQIFLDETGSYFETYTDVANTSSTSIKESDITSETYIPMKLSFGLSYVHDSVLKLSANLDLYEPSSHMDFPDRSYATRIEYRALANGSLGLEWAYREWLKFRLGGFTNFSAHPDPDMSRSYRQPDKIDQLGFSANFVLIAQKNIQYTFGGYYTGGRGLSYQRINQTNQIIPITSQVFTMLVGTQFSL